MTKSSTASARFHTLFAGLSRAYGKYTVSGTTSAKGKAEGSASTVQGDVTVHLWDKHLAGTQGLGVVPIRDDNACLFGAIDIDQYDLNLALVSKRVTTLGLPLMILRSKSGGAHLYLFLIEPTPAVLVRSVLTQWAIALGFPGVEIFPKQDEIAGDKDVGNWINMPYFDATHTMRYALHEGESLEVDAFLDVAEGMRTTGDVISEIEMPTIQGLEEAPPCLEVIVHHGMPEGNRNNALFAFGVYARLSLEDEVDEAWKNTIGEYNHRFMDPPLATSEVNAIIKSLDRKKYFYPCKKPPLCNLCNKSLCRKRKFGIGNNSDAEFDLQIDGVTKILTVPPIWIFQIAGKRMQLETDEFKNQGKFALKCIETLNYFPPTLKVNQWAALLNELLKEARAVPAPVDSGSEGVFMYHLKQFTTVRAQAREKDELLLGKAWTDNGHTYFRGADLMKYLDQQHFRDYKTHQIWPAIRGIDGSAHHQFHIKGDCVQCWSIPTMSQQTEEFTPPKLPKEDF